ncbi:SPT3 Dosage dependent suppressor of Ty-induced promoter mutations-like protein [Tilletia horrida]|nr:SPT3 Dosage dependent suppressor of Ty-induced promoter mutations-like protein [Tilletia horrida]
MQSSNTEANMFLPPNGLSVDVLQGRFDLAGPMTSKAPNTAPTSEPFSAAPSTFSSRRGSFDSAGIQRDVDGDGNEGSSRAARDRSASSAGTSNRTGQAVALRSFGGSAQNAITDAEIEFSTQAIARPAVNELKDLQIHVHGIQMQGHKSRVETQIRMRIELVRPAATAAEGGPKFERIGSFSHLKLPPLSGTKRNSKKYQRTDVDPQKTLYFDATVVNATPPHDRIFVCSGCMQRERKRLHRKKRDLHNAASAVPATLDGESVGNVVPPSVEEMKNMGFDPALPGAQERALQQMLKEDRKRVVVFNCGDYVDFFEGETILPTRITCYCRHHKAKVGFCIIFTMRDWQGRLLATGSTPPIMITDDHKTQGSSAKANGGVTGNSSTAPSPVASAGIRPGHSRVGSADSGDEEDDGVLQRQPSPSNNKSASVRNSAAGVVKGVQKKVKKERKKPYDDAGVRRRANGSGAAGLAMTPFAADGLGASPAESSATSPSNQDSSSIPAATPQQMLGNSPPNLPPDIVDAGSLSPSNLLTNPQSVPDFNLEFFLQQHGLQLNGSAGLPTAFNWPQLGALDPGVQGLNATGLPAAPFPVDMSLGPLTGGSDLSLGMPNGLSTQPESLFGPIPPAGSNAQTGADAPTGPQISKLIPGEGPTSGGIEVTILGENFEDGITCVFGDVPATNTRVWAANTLVCILPPSQSPGPVVVTLKGSPYSATLSNFRSPADGPLPLFTYIEASDRALMELALQVVGLQMTGAVQSARDVAMRVVGSGGSFGGTGGASGSSGQTQYTGAAGHQASTSAAVETQSRDAVSGFISSLARGRDASAHSSFQDSILNFLSLLDVNMDEVSGSTGRRDAIRLANKNGHTLLHLAVMLGFHRLAANLLRRGAPVNARDRNGYTALHFAALHGRVTLARLLLSGGARDNIPNWEGQLPIDIAREKDQIDVEMLLADTGSPAAEVHLAASHHDSGVSISERDDETATDRGLEDVEESDESGSTDDSSASEEDGSSRFGEDSALFADDEREASSSQIAFAGLAESDDGSAAGSVDSGRTARRAMAEPALALRAFLARAGDSVAAMEWAQRLHVPGTMDALQARLGTLHFNMRSLPGWPLGRPTARANDFTSAASAEGTQSDVPQRGANGAEHGADGPADPAQVGANPAHASGVSGIGNIAEWANTLFNAPPPTYEDALANEDRKLADSLSDADEKTAHADVDDKGEGTSASAYQQTLTAQEQQDAFVEQGSAQVEEEDEESGWEGEGQGSSHRTSPASINSKLLPAPDPFRSRPQRVGASGSSSSGFTSSVKRRAVALTPRRARRSIYDDAMLFWFWIPALVAVIVVVFLSSGDGVLSFRDLVSYFDLGSSDSSSAAAAAAKQVAEAVVPRAVMPAAMAEGLAA